MRVFVVDDTSFHMRMACIVVEQISGCQIVKKASNAREALYMIYNNNLEFDLLLTDYDMGGQDLDGSYLIQGIVNLYPPEKLPLMILSSSHTKEELKEPLKKIFPDSKFKNESDDKDKFLSQDGDVLFYYCAKGFKPKEFITSIINERSQNGRIVPFLEGNTSRTIGVGSDFSNQHPVVMDHGHILDESFVDRHTESNQSKTDNQELTHNPATIVKTDRIHCCQSLCNIISCCFGR